MDLLAGYGSDASDASSSPSSSSKEDGELKPILKKPTIDPSSPTVSLPVTKKSTYNANDKDNNQRQQQRRRMKRGKKILSLNAVLPAAIVERLTKREEKGYYTSSSDEEEGADVVGNGDGDVDDNGSKTNDRRRKRRRRSDREMNGNGSSQAPSISSNDGVKSLLDDLKTTKFCKTTKPDSGATTTTSSTTTKESLPLGMAFTKVETTRNAVIKGDYNVIDIHRQTETVKKETNYDNDNHATASLEETPRDVMETKSQDTSSYKKRTPTTSLSSIPRPSKTARLPHPRPIHPSLYKTPSTTTTTTLSPPPPPPPPTTTTKLSKKDIARALRSGTCSIASLPIPTISQPVSLPNASYDPSDAITSLSYATAARAGQSAMESMDMYDPSRSDASSSEVASSGGKDPTAQRYRGKNQINYLAQSAKAFEANRMAKLAMGGGVKNHRVDAKKKYGW